MSAAYASMMRVGVTVAGVLLARGIAAAAPIPPVLGAASVSGTTVTLTWMVPLGATGIRVIAGTVPGGSNAADVRLGPVSAYTATNVPAGVYYVRLRAIDGTGESAPSNEVVVVVGSSGACFAPPTAPTLARPAVTGGSVSLAWTAAASGCPASTFTLLVGSAPGLSNLGAFNLGRVLSVVATASNATYYARIVAQNAYGASAPSNEVTFTIGGTTVPPGGNSPRIPAELVGSWFRGTWDPQFGRGSGVRYDFRADGSVTSTANDSRLGPLDAMSGRLTALAPNRFRLQLGATYSVECLYTVSASSLKMLCGNPPEQRSQIFEETYQRIQ